jgi:hypothetical protein
MYNGYEDDPELLAAIEASLLEHPAYHSEDDALARAMAASLGEDYVRPADQTRYGSLYGNRHVTREEMLDQKARTQSYQAELEADFAKREAMKYADARVNKKKHVIYALAEEIENYANTLKPEIIALNPTMRLNPNRPEHRELLDKIETKQLAIQTKINKYNALAQDMRQWADRNASNNLKYTSGELIEYANLPDVDLSAYDEFVDASVPFDENGYYSSGGRRKPRRKSRAKRGTKKQRKSRRSRR